MIEKIPVSPKTEFATIIVMQEKLNEIIDQISGWQPTALDTKQELTDEDIQRKIDSDNELNGINTKQEKCPEAMSYYSCCDTAYKKGIKCPIHNTGTMGEGKV